MSSEQAEIPLGPAQAQSEPAVLSAQPDPELNVEQAGVVAEAAVSVPASLSAGDLIREAREALGMHPEALASALKVPTRKIEALESGDLDEMPDLAFTRALAAAVCRHLKLEPSTVLALLPVAVPTHLPTPHMRESLRNEDGQMGRVQTASSLDASKGLFRRPLWLAAIILFALAAAMPFLPELLKMLGLGASESLARIQAPTHSTNDSVPTMRSAVQPLAPVASAPAAAAPLAASSAAPQAALPATAAPLVLTASGESWLQVTDASGRVLVSRNLFAGDSVPLTGKAPYRLIVGRAEVVSIRYQGVIQPYPTAMQTGLARLSVPVASGL